MTSTPNPDPNPNPGPNSNPNPNSNTDPNPNPNPNPNPSPNPYPNPVHRRGLFAEQHALREEKVREKMRDDKKEQAPLARTSNHLP